MTGEREREIVVEPDIVDEREDKDDLKKAPDAFLEDGGDRLFASQEQCARDHEKDRHRGFYPEGDGEVERIKERLGAVNENRETFGRTMGEHDQPDAEEAQKFDVEQLLFAGLDVGVGVSFVMGKPSLLIYLRLNHTMNGEEGKGLWGQGL